MAPVQLEIRLAAEDGAPAGAREFAAEMLRADGVDSDTEQKVLLVVSELVTNAVTHGSRDGGDVHLSLAVEPRRVIVVVSDAARGHGVPFVASGDTDRTSGRGLRLVEQCAEWREQIVGGRREVRAEIHR